MCWHRPACRPGRPLAGGPATGPTRTRRVAPARARREPRAARPGRRSPGGRPPRSAPGVGRSLPAPPSPDRPPARRRRAGAAAGWQPPQPSAAAPRRPCGRRRNASPAQRVCRPAATPHHRSRPRHRDRRSAPSRSGQGTCPPRDVRPRRAPPRFARRRACSQPPARRWPRPADRPPLLRCRVSRRRSASGRPGPWRAPGWPPRRQSRADDVPTPSRPVAAWLSPYDTVIPTIAGSVVQSWAESCRVVDGDFVRVPCGTCASQLDSPHRCMPTACGARRPRRASAT